MDLSEKNLVKRLLRKVWAERPISTWQPLGSDAGSDF